MVSVCCITYNQENFIKEALNGFLMQKVDFPIEIVIGDDSSTDSTKEILKDYQKQNPETIRLILREHNLGVMGNFSQTINACSGKYIALCEGDDYWIDPNKLQQQVDFMETHPVCSLCCHKVQVKYEGHEEKNHLFPDLTGNQIFTREEMHGKYISATCSVMFRREKIKDLVHYLDGFKVGDIPLFFFCLELGSFGYIDQVMGTYRKNADSYWNPHYEEYRFPVLFDTFTKIKKKLKIRGSQGLNRQISFYALGLLEKFYDEKNYKHMRQVVKKSVGSFFSVTKKWRRNRLIKFSLIAFFPKIVSIYQYLRKKPVS